MTKIMRSALMQLSEPELTRLLYSIVVLQVELQSIPSQDSKLLEAITSTQKLLNLWKGIVERTVAVKQVKDSTALLGDWANEGGSSVHSS